MSIFRKARCYEVKRRRALIYELRNAVYVEVALSRAFPKLTGDVIRNVKDIARSGALLINPFEM